MRKFLAIIIVLFVLLIVAVVALPSLIKINQYHDKIQAELSAKLNRPVSLGRMNLKIFPLRVRVENAVIAEDPSFHSTRAFAQAQALDVSAKLLPLLRKDVQVDSINLLQPQIELIRDQQGNWNFSSLAHPTPAPNQVVATPQQQRPATPAQKPSPAPPKTEAAPSSSANSNFSLAELKITDGQVAITDLQKHQSRSIYDHIDVTLSDYAAGRPFTLALAAHLPGQGKQLLQVEGKAGPVQQGNMLTTPLDGKIKMDQVSLSGLQKFLNSDSLKKMDAIASGEASLKNDGGKLSSNGTLKLENGQVNGVNIGYPITADYDVSDDLTTDIIHVAKANIKLGPTPISIAGDVNTRPNPAQLDLMVKAQNASITELARLASAFGVAFNPGMQVAGMVNADLHARGASNQPEMNGTITARNLEMSGKELPQPVKVPAIDLQMSPDAIRSNQFMAQSAGTSLLTSFVLSQYTKPSSAIDATIQTNNASLGELLNIAKAYGVSAVEGMSGSGAISLNARVQGPLKHTEALTYSGNGSLKNATINMPSLTKPLQVHNAGLQFAQNSAVLQNVVVTVGGTNANGNITLRNFSAPQVQFSLTADKVNVGELQQLTRTAPEPAKKAENLPGLTLVSSAEAAVPVKSTGEPSMLTKMTGTGSVSIGAMQYDDMLMNNVRSNVTLDRGVIKLAPLTAELFGGTENGTVVVDTRPANPTFQVNTKLDKVDSNKLLSATTSLKQVLYGLIAGSANTSFSSVPGGNIAQTLNGVVNINLQNGKLMNIDLLNQLASVGKFVGGSGKPPQNFTNLLQLAGALNVKNGVASTDNLKAIVDGGTLGADGIMNLVDQTLNMHVTAVLNKDYSQKVGGTGIGGFMNTALANKAGELVIPVIVTGSFSKPVFTPDVQKVAKMKLENLLPTSSNPSQMTSGILGALVGKNGQQGGAQNGVKGILGALAGQQQPQQNNNNAAQGQGANPAQPNQTQQQPQQQSPQDQVVDLLNQLGKKKKPNDQQQPNTPPPNSEPPK
jgi:AsmA protein